MLNHDGDSVVTEHGKTLFYELDASEKVYGDFLLSATNRGGHSSLPRPDNAIYELMSGLTRLAKHKFPFELNSVTRAYYEQLSNTVDGERARDMRAILKVPPDLAAAARLSRDPTDNSLMHTTCVATRLSGGHGNNALPQRAQAVVNCRILPGHSPEEVRQRLSEVIADPKMTVQYIADDGKTVSDSAPNKRGYPPPPLREDVMRPLRALVGVFWPNAPIVPAMATGASDGVYTSAAGIPTYQVTGIAIERGDERAHGRDERIGVESFYRGTSSTTASSRRSPRHEPAPAARARAASIASDVDRYNAAVLAHRRDDRPALILGTRAGQFNFDDVVVLAAPGELVARHGQQRAQKRQITRIGDVGRQLHRQMAAAEGGRRLGARAGDERGRKEYGAQDTYRSHLR